MPQNVGFRAQFDDRDVLAALRRMEQGLGKVDARIEDLEKNQRGAFGKVSKGLKGVDQNIKGVTKSVTSFGSVFKGVFGANIVIGAIQGITRGITNLGRSAIQGAADFETIQTSFEVFLGSAEEAERVLADLEKFSLRTPFEPEQVNNAAKALLAFGEPVEDLETTLGRIGDVASGTGKDFNELAVIYGKARVQGTLFAEDINQLTEAGVPIIDEFAEQLGVSADQVKKLGSEGKITFDNLEQAFKDLTSEGGKFFELTLSQSTTFTGFLSTASGAFKTLLREAGNAFLPIAKQILPPVINGLFAIIDVVRPVVRIFQQAVGPAFDKIREIVGPLGNGLKNTADRFNEMAGTEAVIEKVATTMVQLFLAARSVWRGVSDVVGVVFEAIQALNPFKDNIEESGGFLQTMAGFIAGVGAALSTMASNAKIATKSVALDLEILAKEALAASKEIATLGFFDSTKIDEEIAGLRKLKEETQEGLVSVIDAYTDARDEVSNTFVDIELSDEAADSAKKLGNDLVDNVTEGVSEQAEEALKAYNDLINKLAEGAQDAELNSLGSRERVLAEYDLELAKIDELEQELERLAELSNSTLTDAQRAQLQALRDEAARAAQEALESETPDAAELLVSPPSDESLDRVTELASRGMKKAVRKVKENADEEVVDTFSNFGDLVKTSLVDSLGISDSDAEALIAGFQQLSTSIAEAWTSGIDVQIEENQRLIDDIQDRIGETESALNEELRLQEEGRANNVESKRAELEELKVEETKALKEQQELKKEQLKAQLIVDAATQATSLVTMAANVLASTSSAGIAAPAIAAAVIAALIGLFSKFKAQSKQLTTEAAFTGGPIDQFLAGRSDKYGGRGHRIEDSNVIVGGGEYLVNSDTTAKQRDFLPKLNSGIYNDVDFEALMRGDLNKVVPVSLSATHQIDRSELLPGASKSTDMEKMIGDQTKQLVKAIKEKEAIYTVDESTKKIVIVKNGNTKTIHL